LLHAVGTGSHDFPHSLHTTHTTCEARRALQHILGKLKAPRVPPKAPQAPLSSCYLSHLARLDLVDPSAKRDVVRDELGAAEIRQVVLDSALQPVIVSAGTSVNAEPACSEGPGFSLWERQKVKVAKFLDGGIAEILVHDTPCVLVLECQHTTACSSVTVFPIPSGVDGCRDEGRRCLRTRVLHQEHLLGAQELLGDHDAPDRVPRRPPGIAYHMRITQVDPERRGRIDPRVHARH
jgi:hypothetical protein